MKNESEIRNKFGTWSTDWKRDRRVFIVSAPQTKSTSTRAFYIGDPDAEWISQASAYKGEQYPVQQSEETKE